MFQRWKGEEYKMSYFRNMNEYKDVVNEPAL